MKRYLLLLSLLLSSGLFLSVASAQSEAENQLTVSLVSEIGCDSSVLVGEDADPVILSNFAVADSLSFELLHVDASLDAPTSIFSIAPPIRAPPLA